MSSRKDSISSMAPESAKAPSEKGIQAYAVTDLDLDNNPSKLTKIEEVIEAEGHLSDAEARKLLRKIDWHTVPCLMAIYGLQYADKVSLANGVLFGLKSDTHLKGQEYSWLTTIYYLGYFLFQPLMNYAMQRVDAAYVLSAMTIVWGIVLVTLGLCNNFAQLMAVRFILGALEGIVTPGFTLIVASWYRKSEQNARQLLYFAMNTGFSIWVSVVIYFIAKKAHDDGTVSGWRVINFFLGGLTVFTGCVTAIFLRLPKNAWWLSEKERTLAHARIIDNGTGTGETQAWKWDQVKDAFTDPTTYFIFFINVTCCIPNGGITTFQSLIYQSFGFTPLETILYQLPSFAMSFCWILFAAFMIHKFPRLRFFFMCFTVIPAFVAVLTAGTLPNQPKYRWTRYGVYLMSVLYALQSFLMWALMPAIIGGRTKKTVVATLCFMGYCVGNMIGPQVFRASDAPRYIRGLIVVASMLALVFVLCLCWLMYLIAENRRRRKRLAEMGVSEEERLLKNKINGELDMTDNKNIYFLYAW
ncbi:probable DAL5 - Allantoate and ureidosuccinate permease [Moesziomyces antarcticus]|uniref:Probable DAL5 - Allantoate and ureidosuccinate permease n=2 Tax=Pseudozyma antarctica TaxID=84753 RepID=A0A5C3FFL0_PSEA2|nr:probable DAL5 - Allantoate and ureidosuccinate permease [Moesziomyces antarcticus]